MSRIVSNAQWTGFVPIDDIGRFRSNDLLYWWDLFRESELQALFDSKGYPGDVFQDSFVHYENHDFPCRFWCADVWLGNLMWEYRNDRPGDIHTQYTSNFLINRKQVNRFLTMKLVEYFGINCNYTWSALDTNFDMTEILREIESLGERNPLPNDLRSFILSPVVLPKRWIERPGQVERSCSYQHPIEPPERWLWVNGGADIVGSTAVSIITESQGYGRAVHFSEKTLYSVLGQTFPLWVGGGYGQAQEWEKFGFDVFSDVIDHSYQCYDTLIERCWYAIVLNLELLQDLDRAAALRLQHADRLRKNFDLVRQNPVRVTNNQKISTWPKEIQQRIRFVISRIFPFH